jgi:ABC-2 type transport system ATP-binding protein
MNAVISSTGLSKRFGKNQALDQLKLDVGSGRIVGLIGPNGSGKTTALKAILGLIQCEGNLTVLGLDPRTERDQLMKDVCFIADVALLPRWISAGQAMDFIQGVHPNFDRSKAQRFLSNTKITETMKVKTMSKGMVVQLHLALIMAINAKLLVLDEPTLGLDILYRKQFYKSLLEDYFDEQKTILITTHQIEEVEHILTDVIFIRDGKSILSASTEQLASRFTQLMVNSSDSQAARQLNPIDEQQIFGKSIFLFDTADRNALEKLGELRNPNLSDIFVSMMKGTYQ